MIQIPYNSHVESIEVVWGKEMLNSTKEDEIGTEKRWSMDAIVIDTPEFTKERK